MPVTVKDVLYYGCWSSTGHCLYEPGGIQLFLRQHDLSPIIDAGFLRGTIDTESTQGLVHVSRIGVRYTILSFWDRSVDNRPGSNSNFIIPGYFSYEDAMDYAKQAFPQVFARFKFPVVLAHVDSFTYPEANHGQG